MTHFSADSTQRYYTPNTWLGLAITAVFIGRIAYRFLVLAPVANGEPALTSRMTPQMILMGSQSGLTVALFGLVAGYYVAYYAGVLLRSRGIAFITEPAVSGPG
jgi:hypothetical protein